MSNQNELEAALSRRDEAAMLPQGPMRIAAMRQAERDADEIFERYQRDVYAAEWKRAA